VGVSESDHVLGRLLVEQGLVTPERLQECFDELQRLSEEGMPSRLGDVLVRRGILSPAHFQATLRVDTPQTRPVATPGSTAVPIEVAKAPPEARFGKYVRTERLGAGGMGEVWKAWDTELARWVALKFLKGGNDDEIARFKREAQLAGALSHPHIAAIHDVGETRERHWIAMQFVAGKTLRDRGGKDSRPLAGWLRDAARAVQFAHDRGIVHRDLKPDNLMIADEHLYVMDFGLARSTEGASNLSVSGFVVGTPAYMAPEQARGEKVDGRADVYALGVTLYEMQAGRPPFQAENALDLLRKAQEEEAAPLEGELGTIAAMAMEKDPSRRYASAGELADDLERWLQGEPILARRASVVYRVRKKIAKRKAILIATGVGLALAAGLWLYFAPRLDRAERYREALDRVTAFTTTVSERPERRTQAGAEAVRALEAALAVDDRQMMAWIWLGRCRRVLGQDPSECWERALAVDPASGEALLERGRQRLELYRRQRGEIDSGHTSYREAVLFSPPRPETDAEAALRRSGEADLEGARKGGVAGHLASHLEALSAFGRADYAKAEEAATLYLNRAPWDAEAFLLRARARRFLRKYDEGLEDVRRALEVEPSEPTALILRALLYRDRRKVPEAEAAAREAVAAAPRDPLAAYTLGQVLLNAERLTEAEAAYTRATDLDPRFARAWCGRGWILHSLGRMGEAEALYGRAIELDPADGVSWNRRGHLRIQRQRPEEALADLDRGTALDRFDPAAALNRGAALRQLGRDAEAEAAYTEAIRRDSLFVVAWHNRALVRAGLGRSAEAEADLTQALTVDPKFAPALMQRSRLRSVRGDFSGAAEDAAESSALQEPKGNALIQLAYALAYAGRFADSLEAFRKVVADGKLEYAHFWIWLLETRLGRREEADAALRKHRKAREKEDWFALVADFLTGGREEGALLDAAAAVDPKTDREQRCEAYFYAGMRRLLLGNDREGARALFERSVATGVTNFVEHAGSRAELQRLK
jgi:serine/threonine-protein kinase